MPALGLLRCTSRILACSVSLALISQSIHAVETQVGRYAAYHCGEAGQNLPIVRHIQPERRNLLWILLAGGQPVPLSKSLQRRGLCPKVLQANQALREN